MGIIYPRHYPRGVCFCVRFEIWETKDREKANPLLDQLSPGLKTHDSVAIVFSAKN